jgi:AraC-like DNA-binding protein
MVLETRENGGDDLEEASDPDSRNTADLKPEYCHYKDEGCEYAPSCLECPYPQCLYDEPRGRQQWLKELRNKEINRLFSAGWKVKELALLFGVSQRTIQRALKENFSDK